MHRFSGVVVVGLSAALTACGQHETAQQGSGAPPPAQVTVEAATPHVVPINFEYVGRLEASREVEIRPRVAAVIEHRYFQEGAPVKAGALLYKLDAASFAAQVRAANAELTNRQALLAEAKLELDRKRALAAQKNNNTHTQKTTQTGLAVAEAGVR